MGGNGGPAVMVEGGLAFDLAGVAAHGVPLRSSVCETRQSGNRPLGEKGRNLATVFSPTSFSFFSATDARSEANGERSVCGGLRSRANRCPDFGRISFGVDTAGDRFPVTGYPRAGSDYANERWF